MARLAIIDNLTGKVENIAEAEEINPIEGKTCIFSDTADIGDSYDGANIIKQVKAAKPIDYKILALDQLVLNDRTALRCVKAGVTYPSVWLDYDETLRAIVNSGTGPLPDQPAYPQGT